MLSYKQKEGKWWEHWFFITMILKTVLNLYLFCLRQQSSSEITVIQISVDQNSEFYNALDYNTIHNKVKRCEFYHPDQIWMVKYIWCM